MAPRKGSRAANVDSEDKGSITAEEKIARLLALLVTKEMETDKAALTLDAAGFNSREISNLLGVGPNYVNVAKHRKKTAGAKRPRKKKAD